MQGSQLLEISSFKGGSFRVDSLTEAELFCKKIALGHYENFPVASFLLPKKQRKHIFNIYAFARLADDIADTLLDIASEERIKILDNYIKYLKQYQINLNNGNNNELTNPVFLALANTINELSLPLLAFEKLITAFKMDCSFKQADDWNDLLLYCKYSANPVGELVLRVFGLYDDKRAYLSDCICTALQLTNFWQDFSVDIPNGRIFIPKVILRKYSIENEEIIAKKNPELLKELYKFTENLFVIGKDLVNLLTPKRLQIEISLTHKGGKAILNKCKDLGPDIFTVRPKLTKTDFIKILLSAI